jgi:glycosyltransferase involved in cell wall biosynthesis
MPARLVFIGDGPERSAVDQRVRESAFASDIIFEGEQQNPVPLLSCADLMLLPSSQESFGMAALEAMACEVPVIATRVGGLPELIDDGRTGYLCGMDDMDAMTERAEQILRDPASTAATTAAALAMARDRYSAEHVVPMYEAHYERVSQD